MKRSLLSTPRAANVLTAVILAGVPFHAFLTIWLSVFVGHFTALRLWDEAALTLLVIIVGAWLVRDAALRREAVQTPLVQAMAAYVALTLLLGAVALMRHEVSSAALLYALVINLRFFAWFACVRLVVLRSSWLRETWPKLVFWPLAAVVLFGLLQFFVLPHNFLARFGYGPNTYVPYITINQDSTIMRVQSFLRGANPLGAYLVAMVGVLAGYVLARRRQWYLWVLAAGVLAVLALSFSRSGWIGAVAAIIVGVAAQPSGKKQRRVGLAVLAAVVLIAAGGWLAFRNDITAEDLVLHVSTRSTAVQTSNQGHLSALVESVTVVAHEPLGEGPGTSGQASWYNAGHPIRNTESYFLQLAEEVGWLGLGLFMLILALVGYELWRRRSNPLALGLLAGLCGLVVASQFSYTWADDTLAYLWWGLAAIALARPAVDRRSSTD